MKTFNVPTRETVSPANQALFDKLNKALGKVPNLYATMALSENALGTYLTLQGSKSSLKAKEKEVINLVVSQVNECAYCLSAHTAIAKLNGFTDEQILEIRSGAAAFDSKLNALAALTKSFVEHKGKPDAALVDDFFAAGYNNENLVDAIVVIGDKIITNYLHGVTQVPVDFPQAPALETANA
ncbi:carboxymuconolactone decarboxylase family protein [Chitinophaga japonensis]|uniref:AhpD family alkylhydroperoxidase n=1 Tax=Chitinophaga japonensis TaxID=104662 RepID=A0A562T3W3_CHIJA|nr:carboxymuconolactone decarboxylase family protein [Chitinophaga japonensis]TWI88231.1 AhpD family alkylhydroperoxidase [Chitinophaga japonensis]